MKECIECLIEFEETEFKRCGNGFGPWCNICLKKRMENVRANKKPKNLETKFCPGCKEIKSRKEFHTRIKGTDLVVTYCRLCANKRQTEWRRNNIEKTRERWRKDSAKRRKEKPDLVKSYHFRSAYGLEWDEYQSMIEGQNNKCAICEQGPENKSRWNKLFVDHCHDTGKVRKLLCGQCNAGLGNFQENKEFLNKAIEYLDEHKSL